MQSELRDLIYKQNADIGRRLDLKHHCQTILQGIESFDDSTAQRAIWELIQNARDLSEHASIQIVLEKDYLRFRHNGAAFDYGSLSALVRQVSSFDKENNDTAGQFGTGFMTTHKFSRKIYINGSYNTYKNHYVDLDNFLLDRSATDIGKLCDAMQRQITEVDKLIEKPEAQRREWTEFVYYLDTQERKQAAKEGVKSAERLMPYVMIFNPRIEKCSIEIDGEPSIVYSKKQQLPIRDLQHITICKNEEAMDYYYLQSEDRSDVVVLPLINPSKAGELSSIPHLYIYFPLLGAEKWNVNYIFHSERLFPNEPRSLYLMQDGNADIAWKVDVNDEVMSSMWKMLFDYLNKHAAYIDGGIGLAPIGFSVNNALESTQKYLDKVHDNWVDVFQKLPLIKVAGLSYALQNGDNIKVLDSRIIDFLEKDNNSEIYLDVIYQYAQQVSLLPEKDELMRWSNIVCDWDRKKNHPQWYVTIKDIVEKLEEKKDFSQLHDFLSYLRDSNQKDYFYNNVIILNREGEPHFANELKSGISIIPQNLYEVIKPLVPEYALSLVDEELEDICNFTKTSREELRSYLSNYVSKAKQDGARDEICIKDMIPFCLTFPTNNPTITSRYIAMECICNHYSIPVVTRYVPYLSDVDMEQKMYNIIFDWLVECEFYKIEKEAREDSNWYQIEKNVTYLENLIEALSNLDRPTHYQSEIMPRYAIFPDLNGNFHKVDELFILGNDDAYPYTEQDIERLFTFSSNVINVDQKARFVNSRFQKFNKFNVENPRTIAATIWEKLILNLQLYKSQIVSIIALLDDPNASVWQYWFNELANRKAQLLLECIPSSQRNDVYTLMKIDETRLKTLADLTCEENWEQIILVGQETVRLQKDQEKMRENMLRLGRYVESVLRMALLSQFQQIAFDIDMGCPEVIDQQCGQDIVIRIAGQDVYYIEVKSHWKENSPIVYMSPMQFAKAVDEQSHYALCYVDMTWKKDRDMDLITEDDCERCINNAMALIDIGSRSSDLVKCVTNSQDDPFVGGDYRLVVPLSLFQGGTAIPFKELMHKIEEIIRQNIE